MRVLTICITGVTDGMKFLLLSNNQGVIFHLAIGCRLQQKPRIMSSGVQSPKTVSELKAQITQKHTDEPLALIYQIRCSAELGCLWALDILEVTQLI